MLTMRSQKKKKNEKKKKCLCKFTWHYLVQISENRAIRNEKFTHFLGVKDFTKCSSVETFFRVGVCLCAGFARFKVVFDDFVVAIRLYYDDNRIGS